MYRVELKGIKGMSMSLEAFFGVPNVPCGVESQGFYS